ncbi:hypothetical protein [Micromonospora narathiwatensis]|uniref:hypothetical protein n=1 Tax=Micromonospora narathiwatensis TaxID=299146 RepID=UPI0014322BD1|nr:hypothetical protein [Micromonospora narathiwatensis]
MRCATLASKSSTAPVMFWVTRSAWPSLALVTSGATRTVLNSTEQTTRNTPQVTSSFQ